MKKVYSKPDIFFEDFSMSTNIAAGCEMKTQQHGNGYGYKVGNMLPVFTSVCKVTVENDDWNGICYHNPSEDSNVFGS